MDEFQNKKHHSITQEIALMRLKRDAAAKYVCSLQSELATSYMHWGNQYRRNNPTQMFNTTNDSPEAAEYNKLCELLFPRRQKVADIRDRWDDELLKTKITILANKYHG